MEANNDLAIVKEAGDGYAVVEMRPQGGCDHCGARGLCGAKDKCIEHRIKTKLTLKPGDMVRIDLAPQVRIFSSFVLFLLPILCMVAFYAGTRYLLGMTENSAIIASFIGLGLSGLIIWGADKLWSNKLNYELVDKVGNTDSQNPAQ